MYQVKYSFLLWIIVGTYEKWCHSMWPWHIFQGLTWAKNDKNFNAQFHVFYMFLSKKYIDMYKVKKSFLLWIIVGAYDKNDFISFDLINFVRKSHQRNSKKIQLWPWHFLTYVLVWKLTHILLSYAHFMCLFVNI
jgi:hypothetical protein